MNEHSNVLCVFKKSSFNLILKQAKLQLYISLDGSMVRSFDLKSQGCEFEPHPGHSPCICIAHFLVVELVTRIGLALRLALRGVRVPVA